MANKLPAALCPTTVTAIDDEPNLLNTLQTRLGEMRDFKLFDSPQKAVEFLTNEYQPINFLNNAIQHAEDDDLEHRALDIDITRIHEEIYNADRFSQIAVVILDFSMPGMTGEDVANALKASSYQVVLLTGEASHDHAIDLFNQGLIHSFVQKDLPDVYEKLDIIIDELQTKYFQQLSSTIVDGIIRKAKQFDDLPSVCLNDPAFITYFNDIIQHHNIVEYYLLEASGSFLMLDAQANLSWLLVKNNEDMEALDDMARFNQSTLNDDLANKIKQRDVLMHAFDEVNYTGQDPMWEKVLYPVTKASGKAVYFCSYVTEPLMPSSLDKTKITSYFQHLAAE